jgi:shikimate kinase/3-dehydroquinate synthase
MAAPLFLIGFMAAGKSSVGRAVAAATGRRFVDLDDVIAAAGKPVAELVARDQLEFRRREAAALVEVIAAAGDGPVVATGGGTASFGDNLERMRAAGLVVALAVDVAEAERRAQGGAARPLLADAHTLGAARAPHYRRAVAVVHTTNRPLEAVIAEVRDVEAAWARLPAGHAPSTTLLALGARTYPIVISAATAPLFDPALLAAALPGVHRVGLVTDTHVAAHWAAPARAALAAAGLDVRQVVVAPGEGSKSLAIYGDVCEQLLAAGLDRTCAVVALGGGVVGDLAGLVAASLLRGLPIVQLPTTLVAMIDAAIGGKAAINLPAGKNLIGAFWQPRLVAAALPTLATLPARERRAGFGELWKYALLEGEPLWAAVDALAPWAAAGEGAPPPAGLEAVIARAIAYKASVVGRDEAERSGHRALLNLGHTLGHALETEAAGALLHGEAVALGLLAAARVGRALGHPDLEPRLVAALARTGLSTELDARLTDATLGRVAIDKKRAGDVVRFIVPRAVGDVGPVMLPLDELQRTLRR